MPKPKACGKGRDGSDDEAQDKGAQAGDKNLVRPKQSAASERDEKANEGGQTSGEGNVSRNESAVVPTGSDKKNTYRCAHCNEADIEMSYVLDHQKACNLAIQEMVSRGGKRQKVEEDVDDHDAGKWLDDEGNYDAGRLMGRRRR